MKIIKNHAGEDFVGEAPLLLAESKIKYRLWVNGQGEFCVQFKTNDQRGTCSQLRFPVSAYASFRGGDEPIKKPRGYDIDGNFKETTNTNDGRFLKAVLKHLLPAEEDE